MDGSGPTLGAFLRSRRQALPYDVRSIGAYQRLPNRIGKPVSQEELAEALGISRQWYAQLESDAAVGSLTLLTRVADAIGLGDRDRAELLAFALPQVPQLSEDARWEAHLLQALFERRQSSLALVDSSAEEIELAARRLNRQRERYLEAGVVELPLRDRVARSWQRSRAANVDPNRMVARRLDVKADLATLREANERLLRASAPIVQFLRDELGDAGYGVLLTDRDSIILQLEAIPSVVRQLERIELYPGGCWNEADSGTNAIGTAMNDRRPVQLMGAEHYCEGWTGLTCTAAPIRDPRTNEVIGTLDITGKYELVRPYLLSVITQSALEIEEAIATA